MRIAINGAGIAGTALAFWLGKLGHDVLLVERASALRTGGYVLNLWGTGYGAAGKMGLLPELLDLQYHSNELHMVDRCGRTRGGYPSRVLERLAKGRIATLARTDIAATIHRALNGRVETLFGDTIAALENDGALVRVSFEHAARREVDLVVGADGLHSRVRQLAFGPDESFIHPMGCHVAAFEIAGYRPRQDGVYVAHTAPGRYVSRFPVRNDKTLIFMLFRDEWLASGFPTNEPDRKAALVRVFSDMGWECPAILSALQHANDVYFDSISQIRMDAWAKGRVVLVGDAAACPSLIAGEGAGFAIAQAYVLAGEIHRHGTNVDAALKRYQDRLLPYVARKQKYAEGMVPSFVPKTAFGVRVRDFATLLMRLPVFPRLLMGRYFHDPVTLPDYAMPNQAEHAARSRASA